jgi:hypothetical protein
MDTEKQVERWRNSRSLIWLIYFSAALMMCVALLLGLAGLGMLMPFRFSALGQAFTFAAIGLITAWGAFSVWRMGRKASAKEARFEQDAICFCDGPSVTDKIAWDVIRAVSHRGGQVTIACSDGEYLGFDGYMFFFPSRLGKAIAARAGREFNAPESAEVMA